jgi:hypothetical protein
MERLGAAFVTSARASASPDEGIRMDLTEY